MTDCTAWRAFVTSIMALRFTAAKATNENDKIAAISFFGFIAFMLPKKARRARIIVM
jgi:hypothetical protein